MSLSDLLVVGGRTLLALLLVLPNASAQGGAEERVASALDAIKDGLKEKDGDAVAVALVALGPDYDAVPEGLTKKIDKAVLSVLKTAPWPKRSQEHDPREDLIDAYLAAIGLVFERPDGSEILLAAYKQPHFKDWPELRARIVEGLGYRVDPVLMSFFGKALDEHSLVAAAAAGSMALYSEMPQVIRKDGCQRILIAWADASQAAKKEASKGKDEMSAQDHLMRIQGPFELALEALSRQRLDGLDAWDEWYRQRSGGQDW